MYAEPLILGADEDRRDDISTNKDTEHRVVHMVVVLDIEDGEKYQPRSTDDRSDDGAYAQDLLAFRVVVRQPTTVSQPPLGDEGEIEHDDGRGAAGDEEGFQLCRGDVGNECDGLAASYVGIVR